MASLCHSYNSISIVHKQYEALPDPVKILTVPVIVELRYLSWLKFGKINTTDPKSFVTENRCLFQQPAGV